MVSRWFLIIGATLVLGFAGVYAWLGGFRTPEVDVTTTARPVFLAGQYYSGLPNNDFGKLFSRANELQRNGQIKGTLGNIIYNNPQKEGDSVKAFIGLLVADTTSQSLPAGYSYRIFSAGQRVLRARVNAHFMLAAGRLYPALEKTAKEQKLKLNHVYLEQFPADAPAEVLAVIQ
ncbi:hypothetical protein [Hymenobacter koreensis]|uniref:GyrI-like small molecule binding domain-containing protein n=1 Tax=Hymenobacter koreensis TaxID=1084523 RepID=A0ABP8JG95_9BACT